MTADLELVSIRFPATGHIWIPRRGRRAAAAGLSLHSPCSRNKVLAQRALYLGVRVLGPRIIPGPRACWTPPLARADWDTLVDHWRAAAGDFDSIALYSRLQIGRVGFAALLLHRGRGVAFARVHPEASRIDHEFSVIGQVHAARPSTFKVARPIAKGEVGAAAWMLTESIPNYPLGAVRSASTRQAVSAELSKILLAAMDRPAGTPAHWVPAHGDFSPWNLRTELSGAVRVIDWEDAAFAPPGTDMLYGALTAHTAFGDPAPEVAPSEAIRWLEGKLTERLRVEQNSTSANSQLLDALRGISPHE